MAPRNATENTDHHGDILGLDQVDSLVTETSHPQKKHPVVIVWRNVIIFILLHAATIYTFFLLPYAMTKTLVFTGFTYVFSAVGITAGAHRLWAHRSYKAKLPLRIFLAFCNCIAFQNSIYEWSRDHRAHHKFSETDGDPHNARRGFFFSHIGWLLCKKHPDVKEKGKTIDLSDLRADPVVMIQDKYYKTLILLLCFVLPSYVPAYCWGENGYVSFYLTLWRYTLVLNATWLVNSAAHMWGSRPYDARIHPAENLVVSFCSTGEGFHNYHHTFPHDYSTSEYGWRLNITTLFIDFMYLIGQAYDRRKIPADVVLKRKLRTGSGVLH